MSRSGYSTDLDQRELAMWRGRVASVMRSKRGQAFLREMLAALDAMPEKELHEGVLVAEDGCMCAMGAVAAARGTDVSEVDETDPDEVADRLGIHSVMAKEIAFVNDEAHPWGGETPRARWERVRRWVIEQIGGLP